MGGTTAKVGMIEDGEARQAASWELGSGTGSGSAVAHGSGLPILGSVMDLVEIGAGGGSIAWIDAGGILRVGPQSAGADPGPASYGRGGTEPTVTDANLYLGRIGVSTIAGGRLPLDREAAATAIGRLADALGVPALDAAIAILDVADSAMIQANRLMTIRRGHDPADFDLIAFGGAGPLHACRQATALGFRSVIVPPDAGVLSAFGLLASVPRVDHRVAFRRRLASLDPDARTRRCDGSRPRRSGGCHPARATASSSVIAPPTSAMSASRGTSVSRSERGRSTTRPWLGFGTTSTPCTSGPTGMRPGLRRSRRSIWPSACRPRVPRAGRRHRDDAPVAHRGAAPATGSRRAYVDAATGLADVPVQVLSGLRPGNVLAGPALDRRPRFDHLRRPRLHLPRRQRSSASPRRRPRQGLNINSDERARRRD